MKNLWKKSVKSLTLVALLLLTCGLSARSQNTAGKRIAELDELDFKEMINSVDLGKYADDIKKSQMDEGKKIFEALKSKGCNVETFKNKEIILVTIPAKLLFAPNQTELDSKAGEILDHFKKFLKEPDKYRVLLTMHTDNTGSEFYREEITEERVEAIFDWFEKAKNVDTTYLFTYSFGDATPLVDNDSHQNRDKNRRLEIYIVPGQKMVDQYKKMK